MERSLSATLEQCVTSPQLLAAAHTLVERVQNDLEYPLALVRIVENEKMMSVRLISAFDTRGFP